MSDNETWRRMAPEVLSGWLRPAGRILPSTVVDNLDAPRKIHKLIFRMRLAALVLRRRGNVDPRSWRGIRKPGSRPERVRRGKSEVVSCFFGRTGRCTALTAAVAATGRSGRLRGATGRSGDGVPHARGFYPRSSTAFRGHGEAARWAGHIPCRAVRDGMGRLGERGDRLPGRGAARTLDG
jgi:hypothetical protein